MGLKYKICCWWLILVATVSHSSTENFDGDLDSIIIEASSPKDQIKRSSRQIMFGGSSSAQGYNQFMIPNAINTLPTATATGPCFNGKGLLGRCLSFRQCYPYFKVPEMNNFESWILGMYDTCSYYTEQGRQMFGVCCTSSQIDQNVKESTTTAITTINNNDNNNNNNTVAIPYYPQISNWPPPIPTHPPDHTIPPLPTHPPTLAPGFPTISTPSYPTHYPGYPTIPTQKPTTNPPVSSPSITASTTARPAVGASCGAKNGYQDQERIVGGHSAEKGEWPWIAALFNGGRQFCGGSLIDNIHILSAAHCVAHMSSWDVARLTVRLGDYNIHTNTDVRHIEKRVKRVVRHRGFDPRTLYNDIAILTLESPVQFTQQIRPICLPNGNSDYAGRIATVIGWGSIRESGPQPAILQEVNIQIWSNYECRVKYGPAAPGGIVDHMLCAGEAARDSCSGDSGGPLMINSGRWTQVGIVSWGIGCGKGQYPGVYTRVEKFMPWITKNLK